MQCTSDRFLRTEMHNLIAACNCIVRDNFLRNKIYVVYSGIIQNKGNFPQLIYDCAHKFLKEVIDSSN